MTPLLKIDNVNTYYGESHVLQGLSFDIQRGEIVALLGRNGVGKTTTIQTILGLPAPRSGTIDFSGQVISKLSTAEIIAQGIGWVPQGHRIFPTLSVEENLELASLKGRRGDWNTNRVFEYFPRLNVRRKARGDSLSGGEQQMLAIGRALVQNPDLFLLDEPSEGLSPLLVQEIGTLLKLLHSAGATILIVEQNLAFALSVAERILIMQKGAILWRGTEQDVKTNPSVCQQYLGISAADH